MTVAVVIPTYNRLECLREALISVVSQTFAPEQVIVVDDGSTDGTWEWLQNQTEFPVQALRQARRGPAAARNRGVAASSSRYVAFLDSDDYWLPTKLAMQLDFLSKNSEIRFCQSEEIWIRHGIRVNPMKKHAKPSGEVFAACLERCLISPSAVMMEKTFFEELGGFDESFPVCEDYELWLRASLRSPFQTLSAALTVKRGGHADQLSRAHWGMDRFRVRALEKLLRSETLNQEQRALAQAVLRNKLGILAQGFAKRQPEAANPYLEKLGEVAR
ncbi:MAG TPA: glycosyl transferase [Deltaproteobacteria bacterium]|nr:glycosyl transferase [Deltaproteobacteria bacterium]